MKKPKFLLKVNENNTARVYANGKWYKFANEVLVMAKPQNITVNITSYKTNKQGKHFVVDNVIPTEVKSFHFGRENEL